MDSDLSCIHITKREWNGTEQNRRREKDGHYVLFVMFKFELKPICK